MRPAASAIACIAFFVSACASVHCRGTIISHIGKFSAGTAPFRLASLTVYGNGCVRYESRETRKCLCEPSLSSVFAPATIDEMISAMRIAPRTKFDTEEVGITHGDASAGCATVDLPKRVRAWFSRVDAALGPLIGAGYEPFASR